MNEDSNSSGYGGKKKPKLSVKSICANFSNNYNFISFSMFLFMGTIVFSTVMYMYLPYVGFDFTSPADWAIMFGSGFMITLGVMYGLPAAADSRVAGILVGNAYSALFTVTTLYFALMITLLLLSA